MKLLIVESPAKARTLKKLLKGFVVESTLGHIKDLPKNKLGVDIEHDFKPSYVILPRKQKTIQRLKKMAKLAEEIYLASDPDREGEAIAWHVAEEIDK
ncbi:MAG TPA: type I DNA topoisomerase, partial [Candidatus Desulfofervidus auxilii]|nr:type I DNA topoisomerase [Candidatus Desulfofervidus auxilii]